MAFKNTVYVIILLTAKVFGQSQPYYTSYSYGNAFQRVSVNGSLNIPYKDTSAISTDSMRGGGITMRPGDNNLYIYNGTSWNAVGGGGTVTIPSTQMCFGSPTNTLTSWPGYTYDTTTGVGSLTVNVPNGGSAQSLFQSVWTGLKDGSSYTQYGDINGLQAGNNVYIQSINDTSWELAVYDKDLIYIRTEVSGAARKSTYIGGTDNPSIGNHAHIEVNNIAENTTITKDLIVSGDIKILTGGNFNAFGDGVTFKIKTSGSNDAAGTTTLSSGTKTVNTTAVLTGDIIIVTGKIVMGIRVFNWNFFIV